MKNKKSIQVGSKVTMHFTIKLTDNSIAETTKEGDPSIFTVTEQSVKDPVEAALVGLAAGESKKIELKPEQAYGYPNPNNIHVLAKEKFPGDVEPKVGDIFNFDRASGESVPGLVKAIVGDDITVDFNHPLSGQTLLFIAEIVAIS
jgi:FKBP-type peptidyl-prolyl cis-trans isomerase SlpA